MLKEVSETRTFSSTWVLPELPPDSVWYQTFRNVGSHPNAFWIQVLAMPPCDQAGKAVRRAPHWVFPALLIWGLLQIRKETEGEEPSSEDLSLTLQPNRPCHISLGKTLHRDGASQWPMKQNRCAASTLCRSPLHVSLAARISLTQSNPSPHLRSLLGFPC